MPRFCFEDFEPGTTAQYGAKIADKDEIIAFARDFDPQPFHIDEEAAKSSFVGRLIASGWHTAAMHQRMICDDMLLDSSCMGSPGIDELQWLKPVCPGDRLTARRTILERRVSSQKPDRGLVRFRFELINQTDEPVLRQTNWIMFALRHPLSAAPAGTPAAAPAAPAAASQPLRLSPVSEGLSALEDTPVGTQYHLGEHTFTEAAIIDYATAFDPQTFHVDPEAAKSGPFGRLVSSGWHTAAAWMGCMARDRAERNTASLANGATAARLGPSPGFRNLRWRRPVAVGDRLSFHSTLTDRRLSLSRPGWGLMFHHNTGINQNGETVFEFNGSVFWECRRP